MCQPTNSDVLIRITCRKRRPGHSKEKSQQLAINMIINCEKIQVKQYILHLRSGSFCLMGLGRVWMWSILIGQSLQAERALGKAKIKWRMRDRSKERTSATEVRSRKGSWVIESSSGDMFCHDQHTDVPSCEWRLSIRDVPGATSLHNAREEGRMWEDPLYVAGSCHSRGSCGKWSSSGGTRLAEGKPCSLWGGWGS